MLDILTRVTSLNRPRLLVRAAKFGLDEYSRTAHLPRLLATISVPRSGQAILRLLDIEAGLEDRRTAQTADYSVARHVEVLIALMGEARLLRAQTRPPEPARTCPNLPEPARTCPNLPEPARTCLSLPKT